MPTLPILFFDRELPVEYTSLVTGRAEAVGPGDHALGVAEAVIAGASRRWDAGALALGPRVRVVSRTGVGYDNVDVPALRAIGVEVCHTPSGPTVSTAEHTMALMLAITKEIPTQQARASLGAPAVPTALELDGRVLGLIGFGRIARRVARAAAGLDMTVIAHDPLLPASADTAGVTMVGFDELLATADVVSLHAPATAETHHFIGTTTLDRMKPGSYLVNCARGSLVDQDALLDALDRGHLAGAALDVTEPEPLPAGHRLLEHPRALITPHVASSTTAGRRRLYEQAIDNALAFLTGQHADLVP